MSEDSTEIKSNAKIFGVLEYSKGIAIGLAMTAIALIGVFITVEEPELYTGYFMIAGFNLCCLGITYYMR